MKKWRLWWSGQAWCQINVQRPQLICVSFIFELFMLYIIEWYQHVVPNFKMKCQKVELNVDKVIPIQLITIQYKLTSNDCLCTFLYPIFVLQGLVKLFSTTLNDNFHIQELWTEIFTGQTFTSANIQLQSYSLSLVCSPSKYLTFLINFGTGTEDRGSHTLSTNAWRWHPSNPQLGPIVFRKNEVLKLDFPQNWLRGGAQYSYSWR